MSVEVRNLRRVPYWLQLVETTEYEFLEER
jgi:hypothetical protein